MENQSQSSSPDEKTSVICLAIADKLFKDVDRPLAFPTIDTKPPLTLLAVDSPTSADELDNSLDESPQADTTKIMDTDATSPTTECPSSVLVDTKALNRQKELDERYGG